MEYKVGDVVGNLELLQKIKQGFICRCKLCLKEKKIQTGNLGRVKSGCRCVPRKRKPLQTKDLTGEVFGFLTVERMEQDYIRNRKGMYYAVCRCKCGREHWVIPNALRTGRTKSCGCDKSRYEKTRGKNSKVFKGFEDLSGKYYGGIVRRSLEAGYETDCTAEWLWNLFIEQDKKCALTGLELTMFPSTTEFRKSSASLDRISSKQGYIMGNVQWLHRDVNMMKHVYELDYFIKMCKLIAKCNS